MAEKLTKQQFAAVTNRGGKLLVSAAAGSGKTKVLVDRLLSYITDSVSPSNLDDFLIITYTKAAASELRGKIAAKLTERIAEDPENRHLQKQMQRLYLTKISTVHAFCADLLRDYACKLDISADFRVADENECLQIQDRVLTQILDEAYETAADDPDFRAFVDSQGFGRDDRQIPEILLSVYRKAKCHLNPDGWLNWCVSSTDATSLTDASETVWGHYLQEDLFTTLDLYIAAMDQCAREAQESENMEKPAALLFETVEQLRFLRSSTSWDQILQRSDIAYGTLSFSKKCQDTELIEQIKAVRNACKDAVSKKLRRFNDSSERVMDDLRSTAPAVRGLIALVRKFSAAYDKQKNSRMILDFSDMEHRTLDLLLGKSRASRTVAAKEIGMRFREVMVDEYQDSNSVQDAIFEALTEDRQNLFMVGDVKQSIYQFRLADPGIFLDKYNRFSSAETAQAGKGRKILLSSNFRSGGPVIDAVNDVFAACMTKETGGLDYTENEALNEGIAHIALGEPEVELHAIRVDSDTYAEEASFVADHICNLLDGTHMVRDKDGLRAVIPEDVVILLRSPGSVGRDFQTALTQRGIRCVTGSTTDLLQTEEIQVLRSILQIISNPLQDIPLIAAMSSRVFGFTADDLAGIRAGRTDMPFYNAVKESGSAKACAFLEKLTSLRFEARMCSLSEILDRIYLQTNLDSIYSAMADGQGRMENLQYFYQLTVNYENNVASDLGRFLEYLAIMEVEGLSVSDEKNSNGAVTIMSIHKSKGLEFPVVYLCGLSKTFNMEDARGQVLCHRDLGLGLSCVDPVNRVRYPSVVKRAIATKMMHDTVSEELRVLYVAMTRAKDRLVMTYASASLDKEIWDLTHRLDVCDPMLITGDVSSMGEWVLYAALQRNEAKALFSLGRKPLAASPKKIPWLINVADGKVSTDICVEAQEESDAAMDPAVLSAMARGLSYRYPYLSATKTPSKQTATQLKGRYKDQEVAEGTSKASVYRKFRVPRLVDGRRDGAYYGTAMHAAMQYIRYDSCGDEFGVRREIQRLVDESYISAEQASVICSGDIAALFQSQIGRKLMEYPNVVREFKFSVLDDAKRYASDVENESILLQGVVDCALIEEDGITIIDFKTDTVTEETLPSLVDSYRLQVQTYAYAMERIYKLPIKSAMLYFFRLQRFVEL